MTALAGRVVLITGLYEVVAALSLSLLSVAILHFSRWRPTALTQIVLSVLLALTWQASAQTVDAWAFHGEQVQWTVANAMELAPDLAASGAQSSQEMVDLGLQADTGFPGLRGAWLATAKSGVVVLRALRVTRVVPAPFWAYVLWISAQVAFVAVMLRRALARLRADPN